MRSFLQILGSVCILLGFVIANSSNNSLAQTYIKSWQEISSALHRTIDNNLPVVEGDKGFSELIILLKSEKPNLDKAKVREIRKGSSGGISFMNIGSVIAYQEFDIVYFDDSKETVSVKNWYNKSFDLFLRQKLLKLMIYLSLIGGVLIFLGNLNFAAVDFSIVKEYILHFTNNLKLDKKEFKKYKTHVYVGFTMLVLTTILTQCTGIIGSFGQ